MKISLIAPSKMDAVKQMSARDNDANLGLLVLEQALRTGGFEDVKQYDLREESRGMKAAVFQYDGNPDFEDRMIGYQDLVRCVSSSASKIADSDVYMITLRLGTHGFGLKLAKKLKQEHRDGKRNRKGFVFVGGPSVAETTERIMAIGELDAACYGYGEDTAVDLARFAEGSKELKDIPNIYFRDNGEFRATDFVLPSRFFSIPKEVTESETERLGTDVASVLGAYGCEWCRCNYCYLFSKPRHYHERDLEEVADDFLTASDIKGVTRIDVLDESFIYRLDKFLELLKGKGVTQKITFFARPNQVLTKKNELERFIQEYEGKEVGVFLGAESFDHDTVQKLHRGVSARQTIEAAQIVKDLARKYKGKFDGSLGFFLWTEGASKEDIRRGLELWESVTKGEESPADLLKPQRYNLFSYPTFAEDTRARFERMNFRERELAVTYPYGYAGAEEGLVGSYAQIYPLIQLMPFGPHEIHARVKQVTPDMISALNEYGRRLITFPYETLLRLHLEEASYDDMARVIMDINQIFRNGFVEVRNSENHMPGSHEDNAVSSETVDRITRNTPESRRLLEAIVGKKNSSQKNVGRNDPCPCGSGKKFKKCCGRN